jgi:hypothetical protein
VGVGLQWLLQCMVARFGEAPEHLSAKPPSGTPAVSLQRLEAELDELWSFVGKKANRQWVWIAMGRHDPASPRCPCRGSQRPERSGLMGEDSRRVSAACGVLYGSLCR